MVSGTMRYTSLKEKWVDEKIQQDMNVICEEILKVVRPISILLTGGFGRGEGSVLIKNKKVYPLRDYDILVVINKTLPNSKLQLLEKRICQRLGYSDSAERFYLLSDFVISILQTTPNNLSYSSHIAAYEIKTGSKILYGEDTPESILLSSDQIPMANALHVLFMKTVGFLGQLSSEYLQNPPDGWGKINLIYECGKTYIEIATALTLVSGIYEPTYLARCQAMKGIEIQELSQKLPYLNKRIDFFTHLKLFPDEEAYRNIDAVKLWFETRNALGIVLKYVASQCLKVNSENWIEFSRLCCNAMKREYLRGLIEYYIRARFRITSKPLVGITNFLYQRFFSLKYAFDLYRQEGVISVKASLRELPIFQLFTLAPLLLFSLNEDGSLDKTLFDPFAIGFEKVYPFKIDGMNDGEKWDVARYYLLKVSSLYTGQK